MKVTVTKTGAWLSAKNALSADMAGAVRAALAQEAEFMADKVRDALARGPHEKLSPLTLRARRLGLGGGGQKFQGTKPLLRSRDLYNSIAAVPNASSTAFHVGVPRAARARNGQSLARLADIHERGRTIVMALTPKMIRFLFGVLLKGAPKREGNEKGKGTKVLVIHIPARPFLGPAFAKWGPTALPRFEKNLLRELKGVFGR